MASALTLPMFITSVVMERVSDLRDADVHGETRGHHQWVWTQVVHALTGHRDGVWLRTASSVVGILHLDLPNALLGRVDEHHFDVVEVSRDPAWMLRPLLNTFPR